MISLPVIVIVEFVRALGARTPPPFLSIVVASIETEPKALTPRPALPAMRLPAIRVALAPMASLSKMSVRVISTVEGPVTATVAVENGLAATFSDSVLSKMSIRGVASSACSSTMPTRSASNASRTTSLPVTVTSSKRIVPCEWTAAPPSRARLPSRVVRTSVTGWAMSSSPGSSSL